MKNLLNVKIITLNLLFILSTTLHGMYTESDMQICEFLSAINGDHKFIVPCKVSTPEASDLYIYQCIKAISNNIEIYIVSDVIDIIMNNIRELRKDLHTSCYKNYPSWCASLKSIPDIFIDFIEASLNKNRSHEAIANTLKTCLRISGKSLGDIKDSYDHNIFKHLFSRSYYKPDGKVFDHRREVVKLDWAKIICLAIHNDKEIWELINEPSSKNDKTVLDFAIEDRIQAQEKVNFSPTHEHYRLVERWLSQIEIVKFLESYRPKV